MMDERHARRMKLIPVIVNHSRQAEPNPILLLSYIITNKHCIIENTR